MHANNPVVPIARSKADIMCLAIYTLAGGKFLRGFMVQTIADRLGIGFDQADEMAIAAEKAGLVRHEMQSVRLTAAGFDRGATLTPLGLRAKRRRRQHHRVVALGP